MQRCVMSVMDLIDNSFTLSLHMHTRQNTIIYLYLCMSSCDIHQYTPISQKSQQAHPSRSTPVEQEGCMPTSCDIP